MSSPLAQPQPWNVVAKGYETDTAPFLAKYSAEALRIARLAIGESVLDVAAGPGTLALQAADLAQVSAIDFSPDMVAVLKARAEATGKRIDARVGDGMALPYADGSFDAAFSMFGLMFFSDRDRGFRELHRVLKPGARAVVSSWQQFADDSVAAGFFGALFAEAAAFDREANADAPPAYVPPLSSKSDLVREMSAAGFRDVKVHEVTYAQTARSTRELFESARRGNVMVTLMLEQLGAEQREAFERKALERLQKKFGDALTRMPMPAYVAIGQRQ